MARYEVYDGNLYRIGDDGNRHLIPPLPPLDRSAEEQHDREREDACCLRDADMGSEE